MVDISVFNKIRTLNDYNQANQEAAMQKQLQMAQLMQQASGGNSPAAIQIANEMAKARASGDIQRMNDIALAAKSFDKGVIQNADGSVKLIGGYAPSMGVLSEAKQTGKNISDMRFKPAIAGSQQQQKDLAAAGVLAGQNMPKVQQQSNQMLDVINQIETNPGLSAVVGAPNPFKGKIPLIGNIPGSPAADFQAKLDQLGGKQFLEAFQSLKGGGQITEVEGTKATNAIASMQTSQSEEQFMRSLNDLKNVVNNGLAREHSVAEQNPYASIPQMSVQELNSFPKSPAMPPQLPLSNYQKAKQGFNNRKDVSKPPKIIRYDAQGNRIQ
jgi:hypothetical protein